LLSQPDVLGGSGAAAARSLQAGRGQNQVLQPGEGRLQDGCFNYLGHGAPDRTVQFSIYIALDWESLGYIKYSTARNMILEGCLRLLVSFATFGGRSQTNALSFIEEVLFTILG
jgi:hypothetical protein